MAVKTQPLKLDKAADSLARLFIHLFLLVVGLLCLLPMWLIIMYSVSDDVLVAEEEPVARRARRHATTLECELVLEPEIAAGERGGDPQVGIAVHAREAVFHAAAFGLAHGDAEARSAVVAAPVDVDGGVGFQADTAERIHVGAEQRHRRGQCRACQSDRNHVPAENRADPPRGASIRREY